ncbi:ribosome maturation factor RimM [Kocuria arenosa]|uniref:ribosome maturation factor RimM n=1 Tax=Kocuria arenosa TaxID=3071446 RepID=UPI0034D734AB
MKVQVARVGKPHGIRGEVTVQLFTDAPEERFAPGARLLIEPSVPLAPEGVVTVRGARWNKAVLVVALEEVPDRNGAETLRGARLYAEALEEDPEADEWYEHELVDLEVRTGPEDGTGPRIGVVTGLRTLPVQDLLEIELDEGRREAVLPFVEEIVPVVDPEGGFVVVTPPPGLLELGLDGGKPDSGDPDSGDPDSGDPDSGDPDSGTTDAGEPEDGAPEDGR